MRSLLLAGILAAGLFVIGVPGGKAASRLDRPGTVALGGGGGYGLVTGEGRYGFDFGGGGNYHILLKYMIAPRWALGFRFENQTFSWEDGIRDENNVLVQEPYENMVVTTFEGHLYYYRARNEDASPYLTAGIGVYRPELRRPGFDTVFPGENVLVNAGLGTELFLRENWALDLAARGGALFGRGYSNQETASFTDFELQQVEETSKVSFSLQLTVGILYFIPR